MDGLGPALVFCSLVFVVVVWYLDRRQTLAMTRTLKVLQEHQTAETDRMIIAIRKIVIHELRRQRVDYGRDSDLGR